MWTPRAPKFEPKECRGLGAEPDTSEADPLSIDEPLLAELSGASVRGRVASGSRAGQPVRLLGDRVNTEGFQDKQTPGCASVGGISLHAGVAVPARDRRRLERLCRYAARPPVATERLSERPDHRLIYRLRHRWRDGTTHMVFERLELVERLAVLVPPPRCHLVRYHGILAPAASWRDEIVPAPGLSPEARARLKERRAGTPDGAERIPEDKALDAAPSRRLPWAQLLARVFAVDALTCPRCSKPMRILAAIQTPQAIRAILDCLGLPSRPPPIASAMLATLLPDDD